MGSVFGIAVLQLGIWSVPGEFGGKNVLKALPPAIGMSIAPRTSLTVPDGEVLPLPVALGQGMTSLNMTVFDVPSEIVAILVPFPVPNRSPSGNFRTSIAGPNTP